MENTVPNFDTENISSSENLPVMKDTTVRVMFFEFSIAFNMVYLALTALWKAPKVAGGCLQIYLDV